MRPARMSLSIRVVTAVTAAIAVALLAWSFYDRPALVPALVMAAAVVLCAALAPVSYEVTNDGFLRVRSRVGGSRFGPISAVEPVPGRFPFTIRVFGDGGVFGVLGFFWNRPYGLFRAYATSARPRDALLVTAGVRRVLITPEDPEAFAAAARAAASGAPCPPAER